MAESFSQEKLRRTHRRKKVDEKSCVTPAGTSNELDVQNEWEENTHTHTYTPSGRKTSIGARSPLPTPSFLSLSMPTCGDVGSHVHALHQGARHQTGTAQVGDILQ